MEAAARPALTAFAAAWALAIAVGIALPLVADEAYYLAWSRDLAAGYLDHPPGIAWWIAAGGGSPRLPGLLLVPLAWLLLADAARRFGAPGWRWLPALAAWTPLGLAAAALATPDTPLLVAWCGTLWAVAARRPWLAGVAFGACLWAKSTALVALPGLLWALGRDAPRALLAAAAVYAPHVAWSLEHAGLPWTFQAGHRRATGFHLPEAIAGQLAVVTPGLFALAVVAWRRPADDLDRRLRALSMPIVLVWMTASCLTRVEANWPALAWPAAAVMLVRRPLPRWALVTSGGLTLAGGLFLALVAPRLGLDVGPPRDGDALRACIGTATSLPPVAARYQEKALLDVGGPSVAYRRAEGHRISQYDHTGAPAPPPCDFVYLASPSALGDGCTGIVQVQRICGREATMCRCREVASGRKSGLSSGLRRPP